MIFNHDIKEIYDSISFRSNRDRMQAYKEALNGGYYLTLTLLSNHRELCSYIPNNKEGYFYMENVENLLQKNVEAFVRTRRQRIWDALAKTIILNISPFILLGKVYVAGEENKEESFPFNSAFKDKAISYGYKEDPNNGKEVDSNVFAFSYVGGEAMNVIEKYVVSLNIYLNRINKEYHEIKPNLTEEEIAEEERKHKELIRAFSNKNYTNEEIDSFEKAVLSTFDEVVYRYIKILTEVAYSQSFNDYQADIEKANRAIANTSELLMLTALKEVGEEENSEEHRYTEEQAAFVVNYAQLKYDDNEEE